MLPTDFYAQFHLDLVRCIKQLDAIVENVGNKLGDSDVELVLEIRAKSQQGFNDVDAADRLRERPQPGGPILRVRLTARPRTPATFRNTPNWRSAIGPLR